MVALPGTRFYAPQARLVDAKTNKIIGATKPAAGSSPSEADLDLISAKATLAIGNVCQLQVVLNNQRFVEGMPASPPWKYNGLSRIHFGQRLRLDVRYGDEPWSKMILARVTDLQFSFPSSGAAQLTVIGEDLLSLLKTKPETELRYRDRVEDFIVHATLNDAKVTTCGLQFTGTAVTGNPLTGPLVPWPQLPPLKSLTQPSETTYLQFLQGIAERMDMEMFIDFTQREADDSQKSDTVSDVKLHFEPARSLVDPKQPLVLRAGKNLVELTPKFKVWEQLTGLTIAGTKHGTRKRHSVEIKVSDAEITSDLKRSEYDIQTNRDLPADQKINFDVVELLDAATARTRFFCSEVGEERPPKNQPAHPTSNIDEPRAKLKGIAMLRKSLREFLTATGSTFGMSDLRPGVYVNIDGMYPPFDGYYYVTETTHTVDGTGYRTQFSLRRPGMLDPAKYPDQETS